MEIKNLGVCHHVPILRDAYFYKNWEKHDQATLQNSGTKHRILM